ncbi:MAG TPA: arginyltransferase [Sulfurovum sp.]|nr:arginyltransferase [Sulfurovum sp.]
MNTKINIESNLLNPSSTDFCMLDYDCAYLSDKMVRMNYKYIEKASKRFATAVVHRGWRRFGKYFFYPICEGCNACKSLRINISEFKASKSQRRVIKKNIDTQIIVQRPSLSREHIRLYNKYHAWKSSKDSWRHREISQKEYFENFVEGAHDFGKEVIYLIDGQIVGVDLIDIVDDGISSIYFYYDPDFADMSLGTYSLLYQIELAKKLKLPYIYLGYWVDGCKAFAYKTNFKPMEILDGFPELDLKANWLSLK